MPAAAEADPTTSRRPVRRRPPRPGGRIASFPRIIRRLHNCKPLIPVVFPELSMGRPKKHAPQPVEPEDISQEEPEEEEPKADEAEPAQGGSVNKSQAV